SVAIRLLTSDLWLLSPLLSSLCTLPNFRGKFWYQILPLNLSANRRKYPSRQKSKHYATMQLTEPLSFKIGTSWCNRRSQPSRPEETAGYFSQMILSGHDSVTSLRSLRFLLFNTCVRFPRQILVP